MICQLIEATGRMRIQDYPGFLPSNPLLSLSLPPSLSILCIRTFYASEPQVTGFIYLSIRKSRRSARQGRRWRKKVFSIQIQAGLQEEIGSSKINLSPTSDNAQILVLRHREIYFLLKP